jgi:hypothetical protein
MQRAFFALVVLTLILGACTQRMICPAYQSAFIYDKDELRKRFSYFEDDSTPKVLTASKNKFLIAETPSYRKKIRTMQTVPMKPVNVVLPDSLVEGYQEGEDGIVPGAELDLAARSVVDSIYIEDIERDSLAEEEDSVYMITKDKEIRVLKYNTPDSLKYDPATGKYLRETPKYVVTNVKFNVEQDNYMWYLRDYLVLPDVRIAKMGGGAENSAGGKTSKKKEKKGFFRNIFKKKKKDAADTTAVQGPIQPSEDDFDYVDEDEQLQAQQKAQQQKEPEKKGGFLRRNKKADDASEPKPEKKKKEKKPKKEKVEDDASTEEEKPAEEEDEDGF